MPTQRFRPEEMDEGAGARVRRLFPVAARHYVDPFVLFDEFFVAPQAGFPDHPHRGFEAITYLLEGNMHHRDNLGNDGVVGPGGAQRFTAGRGIVHSEMPEGGGTTHGIQIWVNLPKSQKDIEAGYQQVGDSEVPETKLDGFRVRTVVGPGSPLRTRTPMLYLDIELAPGGSHRVHVPAGFKGIAYVLSGEVRFGDGTARAGEAIPIESGEVDAETGPGGRYLLIAGRPHNEPVYQHGPYVD